jgi:hypothetical protein
MFFDEVDHGGAVPVGDQQQHRHAVIAAPQLLVGCFRPCRLSIVILWGMRAGQSVLSCIAQLKLNQRRPYQYS